MSKRRQTVSVDTGQVMVIDPVYLFGHDAWQQVVRCAYPSRRVKRRPTMARCLKEALGRNVAFALYLTPDGDGDFAVDLKLKRLDDKARRRGR